MLISTKYQVDTRVHLARLYHHSRQFVQIGRSVSNCIPICIPLLKKSQLKLHTYAQISLHFIESFRDLRTGSLFLLVHFGESRSSERAVSPESSVNHLRRGVVERLPFNIHNSPPSVTNWFMRSFISSDCNCSVL